MFWLTTNSARAIFGEDYHAWEYFGPTHLFWLGLCALLTALVWIYYPKMSSETKRKLLKIAALLMFADEMFKDIPCLFTNQFDVELLPLHICSVNIFMSLIDAFYDNKVTKAIMTCVSTPAALCAMIVPTWRAVPIWNFNHIHSETVHILLFLYPMMLLAGGYRPGKDSIPALIGFVLGMFCVAKPVDLLLGTNFMFLTHNECNPALMLLESLTGKFYNLGIVAGLIVFCSALALALGCIPVKAKVTK